MRPTLNPTYTFSKSNRMLQTSIVPSLFAVASSALRADHNPHEVMRADVEQVEMFYNPIGKVAGTSRRLRDPNK